MQPAADPSGSRLVAVRRQANVSDLFILQLSGRAGASFTHDGSPTIENNHWAFYPRFSPDGSQIFYDHDPKDPYNSYRVDLAIFASPTGPAASSRRRRRSRQTARPSPTWGLRRPAAASSSGPSARSSRPRPPRWRSPPPWTSTRHPPPSGSARGAAPLVRIL